MAYCYDLKTGLPAAVRPVLRLHIFDIFDIFDNLTYNLEGIRFVIFFCIFSISVILKGGGTDLSYKSYW